MDTALLAFIVVTLAGAALIVVSILQKNKAKKAAETWLPASGTILNSRVETHRSRDSKGNTRDLSGSTFTIVGIILLVLGVFGLVINLI